MSFVSYEFILAFLPILIIAYYLINRTGRGIWSKWLLIAASLVFYSFFGFVYLSVFAATVLVNYLFVVNVEKHNSKSRAFMILGMLLDIGLLFVFKYYNFFADTINSLGAELPIIKIILPVGISFYTFKLIALLCDRYKAQESPKLGFTDYILYMTYFPTILQGPITYFDYMAPQFDDPSKKQFNSDNFASGIWLFATGLFKKVILGDNLLLVADYVLGNIVSLGTTDAWIGIFAYTCQLYFDFSGYCDMAYGISRMINIEIPMNFNSPYRALSIEDIWKRWHMTLTGFFTKYVYIPLGGNRRGSARTCLNILIVFLLSGLWHGANWTFILWGAMHGIVYVAYRLFTRKFNLSGHKYSKPVNLLRWAVTFLFWMMTLVIFRSETVSQSGEIFSKLLTRNFYYPTIETLTALSDSDLFKLLSLLPLSEAFLQTFTLAGLLAVSFVVIVWPRNSNYIASHFRATPVKLIAAVVIFFWSIITLSGEASFVYWAF